MTPHPVPAAAIRRTLATMGGDRSLAAVSGPAGAALDLFRAL